MKMLKILKYIFLLLITEIALFVLPMMLYDWYDYTFNITFTLNAVLSWYYIKEIEKLYYKKYDKLSSMLYNVCPLIGVILLSIVSYSILKLESSYILIGYYVPLYIAIYLINLIYVIVKNINNK